MKCSLCQSPYRKCEACRVEDARFSDAWEKAENRRIMRSASSSFAARLNDDERRSIEMDALWYCLRRHDDKLGNLFTTSLYNFVHKKCINAIKSKNARKNQCQYLSELAQEFTAQPQRPAEVSEDFTFVKEKIRMLKREDRELLEHVYVEGYTAEELGDFSGCTKERMRQKLTRAISRLRELCLGENDDDAA